VDGKTFFQIFCSGPSSSSGVIARSLPSSTAVARSLSLPSSRKFASVSLSPTPSYSFGASSILGSSSVTTNNLYTPLAQATTLPGLGCYPEPIVLAPDLSFAGYFVEGQADLAIATIPTFTTESLSIITHAMSRYNTNRYHRQLHLSKQVSHIPCDSESYGPDKADLGSKVYPAIAV